MKSLAKLLLAAAIATSLTHAQQKPAVKLAAPTPEQILGFKPGTDRKLADFADLTKYFQALAAASPRVKLSAIGKSTEGREMFVAAISSEANLQKLARYKDIGRQLAEGRLADEAARALAREGRTIVWVDFGLHATEVAPAQVSAEVAYAVATSESDEMKRIRSEVILVAMPVMNPDGLDIVSHWYREQVGTPYEGTTPPVLYQKYAGHDNNRDWYMQNLAETRVITNQLYREWYPQLLYNQHQSGQTSPRIWTPPMDDPVNPNMHPLINRGITALGAGIQQRLEQEGKTGAQGFSQYSNWWNGGMRSTPCFHNIVSILTETASSRLASPVTIAPAQLPRVLASGESASEPSTWNASPWPGGRWSLSDQTGYIFTATMAVLKIAADDRESWLYNRHQMARDQIALGRKGAPYAYVIPTEQHDWPTAVKLASILQMGAVDVSRAKTAFVAGGKSYPAGSFVVLLAQPNRGYAKDLLEAQLHPNRTNGPGGTPKRPYDMAGWTLPYQMGVRADAIKDAFEADLEPASEADFTVQPTLDRRSNASVKAAMDALARGERVAITPSQFVAGSTGRALRLPRVGVYKSYVASMDEGWIRYTLEQFSIPFTTITNKEVGAGSLRSRFDTIVLASQDADTIVNGHAAGSMPAEFTGGIGLDGVAALRSFVESGGTLFAVDAASALPIRYFNIGVRDALDGVRNTEFYCPGSLLRMNIDTTQPLMAGMPAEQAAFFVNGRAFDVPGRGTTVRVLARYAETELLMSGWINGGNRIAGKAAALEVPLGTGRVVMTGFGVNFRGQPHGTFKFLFNAILESAAEGGSPSTNRAR